MRLQSECVYEMSHQALYLYKFKWPSQADLTCHTQYYIIINNERVDNTIYTIRVIFSVFHEINSIEYLMKLLYHQHSLLARKVFFFWHICVPASADLLSRPLTCESVISEALSLLVWWSPVASTSVHSPTPRTVRPWTISYYGMWFSLRSAKTNNCCFSEPSCWRG